MNWNFDSNPYRNSQNDSNFLELKKDNQELKKEVAALEKEKKSLLNKIKELNKSQETLNNNIDKLKAPISYQNKKILKSAIITGSISLAIIACSIVACFFGAQYFLMTLGVSFGICTFNIMFSLYYFYYKYNIHSSLL